MDDDEVEREIAARRQEPNDPFRRKEKPDPWPILERHFSRIAAQIRAKWGTQDLDAYFRGLVIDERGGREGFPPHVLDAILEVAALHRDRFRFDRPMCPWAEDVSQTKWWDRDARRSRPCPDSMPSPSSLGAKRGDSAAPDSVSRGTRSMPGAVPAAERVLESAIATEVQADLERLSVRWPALLELPIRPLRGGDDLIRLELAVKKGVQTGGPLAGLVDLSNALKVVLGTARAKLQSSR